MCRKYEDHIRQVYLKLAIWAHPTLREIVWRIKQRPFNSEVQQVCFW